MIKRALKLLCGLALLLVPPAANAQDFGGQLADLIGRIFSFLNSSSSSSPSPSPTPEATPFVFATPTPSASTSPSSTPSASATPAPSATPIAGVNGFGAPISGLSGAELARFIDGQQQFIATNGPQNGLGPIFNAQGCVVCHTQPVAMQPSITLTGPDTPAIVADITIGGGSAFTELRAVKTGADGSVTFLLPDGRSLFHFSSLPALGQASSSQLVLPDNILSQEIIPPDANTKATRRANALFGFGLIDNIPDETIRANVHNPPIDGVSGRVSDLSNDPVTIAVARSGRAPQHFVGRFFWKADAATLLQCSANAYLNEMGVTNDFFVRDLAPNGDEDALKAAEPLGFTRDSPDTLVQLTPDSIQDKQEDIDAFTDFMQFLSPGPPVALSDSASRGQQLFSQVGCVLCHLPSMMTGQAASPALSFRNVPLLSDLLLHDLGPELQDHIPQGAAKANEMRTAPLGMGLLRSRTGGFLHDGRAQDLITAVRAHGGESTTVTARFNALSPEQQQDIIAFLDSN